MRASVSSGTPRARSSRADDLGAIVTLGFRGEALPSMASVSHFRMRTRARGTPSGTEIRVNAGVLESVVEAGGPEGTLVEVADLFYNLPARRKFLKSDAAESAQISKTVTQLALCYPRVGFLLMNAGRKVLSCPPVTSIADRLYQLYGDRPDLVTVEREAVGLRMHGFVAALAEHGPTRGPQHVFVNRRIVKDKTIAHAIFDAYSVASNKERSPEVHLFLEVPPDRIDVNVHPTKAEVRFKEQSLVHEIVRRAVADALGRGPAPELTLRPSDLVPGRPIAQSIPGVLGGGSYPNRWAQVPTAPSGCRRSRHVRCLGPVRARRTWPPWNCRQRWTATRVASRGCSHNPRDRTRCGRSSPWGSSATRSSSRWTTRESRSSISTSLTSACCSNGSCSG